MLFRLVEHELLQILAESVKFVLGGGLEFPAVDVLFVWGVSGLGFAGCHLNNL